MYKTTQQQNDDRDKNYKHYSMLLNQCNRYLRLREGCKSLSYILDRSCPESRELSKAQEKLEEVLMWANAAIARNE